MLTEPVDLPEELQAILASNGARLHNLQVTRNTSVDIQRLMLHVLVEEMYPEPDERAAFEMKFQRTLADIITDMENQPMIATAPPGLLVPNGVGSG